MLSKTQLFAIEHLPHHLVSADRSEQAEALLNDLDFIEKKIELFGVQSVIDDLEFVKTRHDLQTKLIRIQHLLHRCDQLSDIASTLRSHIEAEYELIHTHQLVPPALLICAAQALPDSQVPGLIRTFTGIDHLPLCCATDTDENWFAAGDDGGIITIWDGETGEVAQRIKAGDKPITSCCFSSEEGELITTSSDLQWWDIKTGKLLESFEAPARPHQYRHSLDKRFAAFSIGDGRLSVWNLEQQRLVIFNAHDQVVLDCAFNRQGDRLVSASADGSLKIWALPTLDHLATLIAHTSKVCACAISPDGKLIASAGQDRRLIIWDAQTGQVIMILTAHHSAITGCCFVDHWLVSVSLDRALHIWDTRNWELWRTVVAHAHYIHGCVTAKGSHILTVAFDRVVRLWDIAAIARAPQYVQSECLCCAVHEQKIVVGEQGNTLAVWDTATNQLMQRLEGHSGSVSGCAVAADGRWCVTASGDHTLRVWDLPSGETRLNWQGHTDFVWDCAISPDDRWVLSSSQDATLRLWDSRTGVEQARFVGHEGGVMKGVFSPDMRNVASASQDHTIRLWRLDGTLISTLLGHQAWVLDCVFNSDGQILLSASRDHTLKLWQVATGKELATFRGHRSPVTGCDISANNQWVISVEENGVFKLWDYATATCLATLHVDGSFNDCQFFADGQRILAVGSNGLYWLNVNVS